MRPPESPLGGTRIAWSYLGAVVGLIIAAVLSAALIPLGTAAMCTEGADDLCEVGVLAGVLLLTPPLGTAVVAYWLRLGWEWWAVLTALVLALPLWGSAMVAGVGAVALLGPALAAVATLTGPRRPAWRPWAVGLASLGLVLVSAGWVLL